MAGPIVVMKRYEFKYILNAQQIAYLQEKLEGHMKLDESLVCPADFCFLVL